MANEGHDAGERRSQYLLILGLIGGLLGIYLSGINDIIGPLLAGLAGVCAIVWSSDAISRVAGYGLGTGVPSIGYMSVSVGVISTFAGLGLSIIMGMTIIGPIMAVVVAAIIGLVISLIATKIIGMKIPIMIQCTIEITASSAVAILAFASSIAGNFALANLGGPVVASGFIAVLFILVTMAVQHPFNACLGPNEDRVRTLKCAASTGFLTMLLTGLMSSITGGYGWFIVFIVGLIGWIVSFKAFVDASFDAAASVRWSGLWPEVEE